MNLHVFYPILIILPYCTPNTFEIFSTTPDYPGIRPHQLRYGRFFCSLSPVGHKTYYGVNRGNIDQARRCCISKNLTLFDLPSRWKSAKLEILRKDLIRSTFIIHPIGRDDQIYVNVAGYGLPWCSAVYFSSTTKIIVRVVGTDCTGPYNYLCEDKTTYPVCSKKNFKRIGPDKLFSKVKLPWREAFECCEDRGQHLMSLPYLKIKDMPDIVKELENETYFWTGDSNPCFYGEWDEIHIDYKGAKRYLYIPDTFANFNDARDCCLANDYTLFTSIVPSDGLMIAEYLTKNETLRFEFQGLASGTWVGARLQGNKRARMLNTKGHAEFPMKGNYPDNYLEGNTGCFTFSLDMRNLFLYQDEECLRKRPFLCEMSTERENNVYSYYDAGSRYYYKDHKTVQRLAKHECMKKEMSLYAPDFSPDFKFVVTGAGQFERLAEPAQKGFWVGYIRFNPPVYLNEFFYQLVPTPDLVDHMIEDDKMEATGEYCNLANVINDITKVMGCSEFFIVHDVYFSITPSNWFDARACCKRLGNWSHKFDLVNIENNTLVDYQLEYVMLVYQTFNHGFWTSGSNYGGRSRLFWYTGHYPLITDSSIFYQRYMEAYDPLPEDDQCIQGHFDEDRNKFQFSHSNCYNMKKFMCVRTRE
ncbi:unnamed protein product [Orchesella dallaii]|uniref:C-type lectin domain-containing protein n=1 Tax=Orchesella dallaii TaxID=48710 RepID=A0ABP1RRK8_9HEXA